MINVIENILDKLAYNINNYCVNIDVWNDNSYGISFYKDDFYYHIRIKDNKIETDVCKNEIGRIGSTYKLEIPIEEQQVINMQLQVLLNKCLEYTKDKYRTINIFKESFCEVNL